ncbi:hypothetical protein [Amycolatopsis sp. NPDC051371]|uniref:hypothetical protein n=1 Tax=Amycolatopsis sp. NPDC051371 TaxID=3155800 RepID=UPI0034395D88
MTDFPFSENPAINPARPWGDSDEVRRELTMWLKKMPDSQKALLRTVIENGEGTLDDRTLATADAINKIAEAFGFVNLVEIDSNGASLAGGAREPLIVLGLYR